MNTWKDNVEPTPEEITELNTIETVINTLFEDPTYGTRQQITNYEIIKAIISLIRNYKIQDRSYYNGYDIEKEKELRIHPKHKKTSLYFKGEQLFTNYGPLDCKLNDPEFTGMRINICHNEIQILFDFYNEKEGYSKKCVLFDVLTKSPIVDRERKEEVNSTSLAVRYMGPTLHPRIGKQKETQQTSQQKALF